MNLNDRLFFWSSFSSITLFIIIKEMINDFPEIVSFILIIINAIAFGYALVGYPICVFHDALVSGDVE